ncbi:MAG: tRNA uridine(34) 5-carboxymethylaminomethyl modification radical SAM/GNAT enzyme Elp3 [Aigarchaeota archaeon]|nr:tRNA uridine(34) 5-carboxymethylaminomethyl modification radical SAM/GNAT enzyme Elp3 [Aigarchaeota archaeon]MCX8192454.1 tRNA uridine(34) 5-carboxymethylaminomethyl modification radical SAM/GNAT enzyme Elp3 [Nitrososphaeria archaeon]MDW7986660.1 tRNA uridine(34) 5-carboxymethylaminomethyl modification radical SAM/GNAT enzyme Elp3 [Nitrososphaerota archaeon]
MTQTLNDDIYREACRKIASEILSRTSIDSREVEKIKLRVSEEYGLLKVPSNLEIIENTPLELIENIRTRLARRITRIISGVTVITVVAPIYECPHGRCIYCPGGKNSPRSYTGKEESVENALRVGYDPYLQVLNQVDKLKKLGHRVDKVELIIIGGTFNAMPYGAQLWFVKRCIDALNNTSSRSFEDAVKKAERASLRISGITIETRPDWAQLRQANKLLELGVTRVELGVQSLDDEIYKIINRGHTVEDVVEATQILKDLGFKVGYHLMPNLPGSSYEKDLEIYRKIWEDNRFRPDLVKIYPTLVLPDTGLYELWKRGEYTPYHDDVLIKLLAEWFLMTPAYVRIQRVQREIPLHTTLAGNKIGNLRERVEEYLKNNGLRCRCIRCREVGRRMREGVQIDEERVKMYVMKYEASEGLEYFISCEDRVADALIGFIRLRMPSRVLRKELENAGIVRELHVYGKMSPIRTREEGSWQHRGYGSMLLAKAEEIASLELDVDKLVVISGIGVREYYYKRGYKLDGPYVSKVLRK